MPKLLILIIGLAVILSVAIFTFIINNPPGKLSKSGIDTVVNQALYLYKLRKSEGMDFSSGPCISNALMNDWVLDIVHSPRIPADDLPENQCPAFLEGKARHFVELDVEGKFIRAK